TATVLGSCRARQSPRERRRKRNVRALTRTFCEHSPRTARRGGPPRSSPDGDHRRASWRLLRSASLFVFFAFVFLAFVLLAGLGGALRRPLPITASHTHAFSGSGGMS